MPSSLDDYEVLCTIGSGSYGTCKKIRRKKDGKLLVWKELDYGTMSETEKQMLVSEVNLLRELKHPNIVRYYDRIIDRSNTTLYIIMEFCQGGDLASLISKFKRDGRQAEEEFVWRVCIQTICALQDCHSRQKNGKTVLHRDLKPANIFLDAQGNVKLGDFGLARVLSHETSFAQTFVGTPYYMSPEQMNYMSYNEKSDVWSLGCLLYELCALRPPFTAANQKDLASKICTGKFNRIPLRYSDELSEIITQLLTVEEHRRPTVDDFSQHPLILKRTNSGRERRNSSTSDESGYDSKCETLRKRQEAILSKEKLIAEREKELEIREKNIVLREKLADERLARAERLMKDYHSRMLTLETKMAALQRQNTPESTVSPTATQPLSSPTSSTCSTLTGNQDYAMPTTPRKQVTFDSFLEKENLSQLPTTRLEMLRDGLRMQTQQQLGLEHTKRIFELRQRLRKAKAKSLEFVPLDIDSVIPRSNPLTVMR